MALSHLHGRYHFHLLAPKPATIISDLDFGSSTRTRSQLFILSPKRMASEQTSNESQQEKGNENPQANTSLLTTGGFTGMVLEQYRKARESAEAYPYVWGSYLIVYGGFGLWVAYRYRKLLNAEERVRALQEKLRILRQEREPRSSAGVSENLKSSVDKPTT